MRPIAAALLVGLALPASAQADVTLSALFQAQAGYSEADVRAMTADFLKSHPGMRIDLEFVPYDALRDKALLAKGAASGYDVILSDSVWTPEYAVKGVIADMTDRITPAMRDGILAGALGSGEYNGRLYCLPWIADAKFLFYNKAMFARAGITTPPRTWSEVEQDALRLKQKGIVEYPLVSSWSQNESLVADYTAILAGFGGDFLDREGKPAFQTGGGLKAAEFMARSLFRDKTTNPNSIEFVEDDVKRVFASGQAAMALNWTYMWDGANTPSADTKVAGQIGVVPAPGVDATRVGTVNGSQPLCVTAGSKQKDAAWEYVMHLTSAKVQNAYATNSLPIWKGSFHDPQVVAGRTELLDSAEKSFAVMIGRPLVVDYQLFSVTLQQALQQVATGKAQPAAALQVAADALAGKR